MRIVRTRDRRQLADRARDLSQRLARDLPAFYLLDFDTGHLVVERCDEPPAQVLNGIPRRLIYKRESLPHSSLFDALASSDRADGVLGNVERTEPCASRVLELPGCG
jgi:hypothetical protein